MGLWLALTITAASASYKRTKYAMAGVGMTPTSITSPPTEQMPAISAAANISPERRVSRPTNILGLCTSLVSTWAPAMPICIANSQLKSSLAIPRTPSVPNNLVPISILPPNNLSWGFLPYILYARHPAFCNAFPCAAFSVRPQEKRPVVPFQGGKPRRSLSLNPAAPHLPPDRSYPYTGFGIAGRFPGSRQCFGFHDTRRPDPA